MSRINGWVSGTGRRATVLVVGLASVLMAATLPGTIAWADAAPAVRAARLTFTTGYVHIDRPENAAGDPALLNMPLIAGQTIVTGEDGQAEVEFEDGSVARVTPNSSLRLTRLVVDGSGNYTTELGLGKGLAYFELRAAPRYSYTVDAGGDLIMPAENTTVRVNLDEWPAAIAVLDGTAHVEKAGSYRTDVHAGETFRSDKSEASRYFLTQEVAGDTWDQWNESRDQAAADTAPKQTKARDGYAGNQGYGWSDLDANGSWYDVPGQGRVWQPDGGDDASFDPYGDGSWIWYPGSGYLWASSYSWGWTPFRCGGWSYWNTFGWGWAPNAACGGYGYAGYGGYGGYYGYGGYGVNIVLPPRNYPILHRPGTGGPGVHPILRVGGGPAAPVRTGSPNSLRPTADQAPQGPRRIAGTVATPLRPIGSGYTPRGGSAIGASLRRDFPVDRTTHAPVLGLQPSHTAVQAGSVNGAGSGGRPGGGLVGGSTGAGYAVRAGVQPGVQQGLRPVPQPGTQQGLRPTNQPAQGSYARPGMDMSGGRPMGQQQGSGSPHYSAPAPQMSHPSYSAPSAPAPQMHSAPASAPAVASPHK